MEKKITQIPKRYHFSEYKRVGIYCRVSTTNRDQINSLSAQASALTQRVYQNFHWKLADVYLDIRSGTSTSGRDQFQRMVSDCKKGNLDIVLTKSISRLGRNTVDILQTLHQLTTLGVEVIFDEQNLSTNDASNSFIISLLETIAEEENRNNSQNTYWGIKKSVMDGSSKLYMRKCYGYTHDSCGNLIIEPQEAEIVQYIFQLYLQGTSIVGIRKELANRGILSPTGVEQWCNRTIDKLLSNEKYIGDVIVFKTITVGFPDKKRIRNDGVVDRFLCASQHPAIISREMFEAVQEEKQRRSNIIEDENGRHRSGHKYSSKRAGDKILQNDSSD